MVPAGDPHVGQTWFQAPFPFLTLGHAKEGKPLRHRLMGGSAGTGPCVGGCWGIWSSSPRQGLKGKKWLDPNSVQQGVFRWPGLQVPPGTGRDPCSKGCTRQLLQRILPTVEAGQLLPWVLVEGSAQPKPSPMQRGSFLSG